MALFKTLIPYSNCLEQQQQQQKEGKKGKWTF